MSISLVKPYFRLKLGELGYTEWRDAFPSDNIPANLLDKSYHLRFGTCTEDQTNPTDVEVTQEINLSCFFKGFREPELAVDTAVVEAEKIIQKLCNLSAADDFGLKQVRFQSFSIEPFEDEIQDNVVRLDFVFESMVFICLD